MNAIVVRIEKLMPMRVARFGAFGRNPESEAWRKLCQWARPRGLLKDPEANPVFGFNQPAPSSPGAEYGYEFWIRLGPETAVQPPFETLDFPGGWYAVTTLRGLPNPAVWMQLLEWVRKGPHRCRRTHELERPHDPLAAEAEMVFDLCLPIEEPAEARDQQTERGTK